MKCPKCGKELSGIDFMGIAKLYSCDCDKTVGYLERFDNNDEHRKHEKQKA